MATIADVPAYHLFMWPIVERLRAKGRSMTIEEMVDDVATYMGLSDEARAVTHGKWQENAVAYRMAWARSYLKKMGALVNSERGVWTLTPKGAAMTEAEIAGIKQAVQKLGAAERAANAALASAVEDDPVPADVGADDWKDRLMALLLALEPAAFERLCQRLLREFGFIKVEVTGKSGDGGIDGTGVLRVNLLSFHVLFQCKRYSGSVGAGAVRDFRGAMVGRTDKGLIITTGTFTADARREATRDGAPAIDLVDGDALCDLLKDRRLGVTVEMVEQVTVNEAAFAGF
ncbi:restriction system protein [Brevundimonas vesicularis]|uniref:Restriction system protein n=1 Tax=Brevundimonas vesicularis TaxID=41276 RepID=A0A7W9L602_BREVE|nr:restriction endonuclease [Brevundimonas vesicularis]MBB5771869.1 restriction system protein [Brevundimonas vesicularis]